MAALLLISALRKIHRLIFPRLLLVGISLLAASTSAQTIVPLYSFTESPTPSPLTKGIDGYFYGACSDGIFKLSTNGLITNLGPASSGTTFNALTLAPDGNFYGTTVNGGYYQSGTFFKLYTNGALDTLYTFDTDFQGQISTSGLTPSALTLGPDGDFYGATQAGGTNGDGTIFKMSPDGIFTLLYTLGPDDGGTPVASLTLGPDGNFYGITAANGTSCTVFQVTTNGIYTQLASMPFYGYNLIGGIVNPPALTLGSDGDLYGVIPQQQADTGSAYYYGFIFKVTTNGVLTNLYTFQGQDDGYYPETSLTLGNDGNLYGVNETAAFMIATNGTFTNIGQIPNNPEAVGSLVLGNDGKFYAPIGNSFLSVATNGNLTTLYTFYPIPNAVSDPAGPNGGEPVSALVKGPDGNLYGATAEGGYGSGNGTIFRMAPNGTLTNLAYLSTATNEIGTINFVPLSSVNGLLLGPDNHFYGTSPAGGGNGCGTIFRFSTNGTFTLLYSFTATISSTNADGISPEAGLTLGSDGKFYGTTKNGGVYGQGTIFQYTTNRNFNTLYSFNGTSEGAYIHTALTLGPDGYLYGTSDYPYPAIDNNGQYGSIFKISTNGVFTSLYDFTYGNAPNALTLGPDGNFYGTTAGNASIGNGVGPGGIVYRFTTNGVFTMLYNFTNELAVFSFGNTPEAPLVVGTNGVLYGTTSYGGYDGFLSGGSIFSLTTNGIVTYVSYFQPLVDGQLPEAPLTVGPDGNLYGVNSASGVDGGGSIYKLVLNSDTGSPSVVTTTPTTGQLWSNSTMTVTGTATDSVAVAGVYYSLNGTSFTLASSTNNWANWSANVAPPPGTNTLTVYAVNAGNISVTNAPITFVYVLDTPLVVLTNSNGTITPNDNGVPLQIGRNFTLTATPSKGLVFFAWFSGVTSPYAFNSFDPVATFTMSPQLTIDPVFFSTNPPALSITNVVSGMQVSNQDFNVMGWATDIVVVAQLYQGEADGSETNLPEVLDVYYSLNDASFTPASTTNNWANWNANLSLQPGTNTFQVFAEDPSGNLSVTDEVQIAYIPSAVLTVLTNGVGSITPNDNGAWLQLGNIYKLTAAARNGFMFTDWTGSTNGTFTVYTNGPILQFMMFSNLVLQANFVDTNKPSLNITNVTTGMPVSNAAFTVMGVATDNVSVAGVYFSFNDRGWSNALSADNFSNWTAGLALAAGTNSFAAYAEDSSGNLSATDNVLIDFVVTNKLLIQANGLGTISPDDSNAWLRVGQNYSITASPATGFVFTNWIISTNFIGGVPTNNATVQFVMASNLTLQANFKETAKPTLTISSPASGSHMTNALATIIGSSSDDWLVTGIWRQLNSNSWALVTTTNDFTNWTSTVELGIGTNTFSAYAVNLGGNYSATNSITLVSTNAFILQLTLGSQRSNANGFSFDLDVSHNLDGHIQVSTNLTNWTVLTNFIGTNVTIVIQDPQASNFNSRFYRATIP
jgi:uncharacterized repeat protein (TIGR03803 family)